jgi:TPR repeat protein
MSLRHLVLAFLLSAAALLSPARADGIAPGTLQRLLVAAQAGNAEAQYHVGMFYNNGMAGATQEPKAAFAWFLKAAAGNDPLGAYKAGCYYAGQFPGVVEVDLDKAISYKRVAANAGYSLAQFEVGKADLRRGAQDSGREMLQSAADQGMDGALLTLAYLYHMGKALPADPLQAYVNVEIYHKYYGKTGNAEYDKGRADIAQALAPAQRAQADLLIAGWVPKPTALTLRAKNAGEAIERVLAQSVQQKK